MPQASVNIRLERLERRVDELTGVRDAVSRMELQFSQLRDEMRMAISALDATVRTGDEDSRRYMRVLYEDLVDRIKTLREGSPLPGASSPGQ